MKIKTQKIKVNNFDGTYKDIYGVVGDKGDKGEPFDDTKVKNEVKDINNGIDALKKMSEGVVWDFETDTEKAYSKPVPNGAKYLNVQSIGGESIVWNQYSKAINDASSSMFGVVNNDSVTLKRLVGHIFYVQYNARVVEIVKERDTNLCYMKFGATTLFKKTCGKIDVGYEVHDKGIFTAPSNFTSIEVNNFLDEIYTSTAVCKDNIYVIDLTQAFGKGNEPSSLDDERIKAIENYVESHRDYNTGTIIDAKVNDIVVGKTHNPITLPPLRSINDDIYDEVDFENNRIIRKVGVVDLGTLNYFYLQTSNYSVMTNSPSKLKNKKAGLTNFIISSTYIIDTVGYDGLQNLKNLCMTGNEKTYSIFFRNDSITDINDFKNSVNGVMLYYELDTPIIEPITQTIEPIKVNTGDTITFEQESTQFPINNKLEYIIKLSERR